MMEDCCPVVGKRILFPHTLSFSLSLSPFRSNSVVLLKVFPSALSVAHTLNHLFFTLFYLIFYRPKTLGGEFDHITPSLPQTLACAWLHTGFEIPFDLFALESIFHPLLLGDGFPSVLF